VQSQGAVATARAREIVSPPGNSLSEPFGLVVGTGREPKSDSGSGRAAESRVEMAPPIAELETGVDPLPQQAEPTPSRSEPGKEFQIQAATPAQRARAGAVDAVVIVLANIPFIALVEMSNGNLLDLRIQAALVCVAVMLYLFYMILMLASSGQTAGMMAAGIVAVDARSLNLPSFSQALGRAIGLPLAAAPALLGFLVPAFDSQRRSLSDIISGTTVKQAFRGLADSRVSWFYHQL
jgi:uncharacterized RDD family membrane protein YckC